MSHRILNVRIMSLNFILRLEEWARIAETDDIIWAKLCVCISGYKGKRNWRCEDLREDSSSFIRHNETWDGDGEIMRLARCRRCFGETVMELDLWLDKSQRVIPGWRCLWGWSQGWRQSLGLATASCVWFQPPSSNIFFVSWWYKAFSSLRKWLKIGLPSQDPSFPFASESLRDPGSWESAQWKKAAKALWQRRLWRSSSCALFLP